MLGLVWAGSNEGRGMVPPWVPLRIGSGRRLGPPLVVGSKTAGELVPGLVGFATVALVPGSGGFLARTFAESTAVGFGEAAGTVEVVRWGVGDLAGTAADASGVLAAEFALVVPSSAPVGIAVAR